MSTTAFVLAVGFGWDDAISDEDQWTVFGHVRQCMAAAGGVCVPVIQRRRHVPQWDSRSL